MSDDLLVQSRGALLDALVALAEHREAVVVIGAQAIYLRTPAAPVALAEATSTNHSDSMTRTPTTSTASCVESTPPTSLTISAES